MSHNFQELVSNSVDFCIPVEAHTKVNGKTAKDMVWVLKRGVDGYTGVNGRKDLKVDTVFDSPILPQRNMKVHGQMDCKMVMGPRRMLTMVRLNQL